MWLNADGLLAGNKFQQCIVSSESGILLRLTTARFHTHSYSLLSDKYTKNNFLYLKNDKRTHVTIKGTRYTKYDLPAKHTGHLHDKFGNDHLKKSIGSANCSKTQYFSSDGTIYLTNRMVVVVVNTGAPKEWEITNYIKCRCEL